MNPKLRNKSEYTGIKRILMSAKYAIDGIAYAYKNEKSLTIHAIATIAGVILGLVLRISNIEWAIISITLAVVLAIELLNTGMEACVDLVTLEYKELAKIAKDCCAGATFVTSMIGVIIAGFIFIPKIIALF